MQDYISSIRTRLPEPRRNYIVRHELFQKLKQIDLNKSTVVKGGAGRGKTTLLASYISKMNLKNVKWISLDEGCNDIFLFWDYIVSTLSEFIDSDYLEYFKAGISRDSFGQMMEGLIDSLADKPDIILVMDDFQYITDTELMASLDFLSKTAWEIFISSPPPGRSLRFI